MILQPFPLQDLFFKKKEIKRFIGKHSPCPTSVVDFFFRNSEQLKIFYIQEQFFQSHSSKFMIFFSLSIKTKNTYPETARNCIIISFACRGSLVSRVMSYRISSSGLIINGGLPSRSSIFGNSTVCRIECATRLSATTLMEGWKKE